MAFLADNKNSRVSIRGEITKGVVLSVRAFAKLAPHQNTPTSHPSHQPMDLAPTAYNVECRHPDPAEARSIRFGKLTHPPQHLSATRARSQSTPSVIQSSSSTYEPKLRRASVPVAARAPASLAVV
ncbi:unnamed protein product [Pleuronectes platessa]|uniref:Uncharacterized protein n=1 Tax=Pleuronectes platessa TaxID=8262 RepID=A0A9N7VFM9_PLEPL|nr:unnamed protein product [Pleuronectes platessa]